MELPGATSLRSADAGRFTTEIENILAKFQIGPAPVSHPIQISGLSHKDDG